MSSPITYSRADFGHSPMVVFYEVTQACDLACLHCRACAQPAADPRELSTALSLQLIAQLASFPKPPMLVLTGGDPLKRGDVFDLVSAGVRAGLEVAMTPSATPLVTAQALARLRAAGLSRLAVSLDGADAKTHDASRGVQGSFERTLQIMREARDAGLALQVNTTVVRRNVEQLEAIAALLSDAQIVLWSVFFLVPVGRGLREQCIPAEQYEQVFERLWREAQRRSYGIKTTEAHHYRRYVLREHGNPQRGGPATEQAATQRAPLGINDGRGVMFVSHTGEVYPSGFLPIRCGSFPSDSVVSTYQDSEVFRMLREPDRLGGKCGQCEYRHVCGGSRARAYAVTGDFMAEEPDCTFEPELGTGAHDARKTPRRKRLPVIDS
jgi:radical SAM protein